MDRNQEYCILAGEFARLCNTTRDTLRYYEKQGILVPYRNESNGYHYYSYAQMASFYFIRVFRQLGCSVAEIEDYLLGGQEAQFDTFLNRQYAALLAEKSELERKIAMASGMLTLLSEIRKADTGSPVICTLPEMVRLKVTPIASHPATSMAEIQTDIRRHLAICDVPGVQIFPMGAVIDKENFLNENYSYKQLFSFLNADAIVTDEQNILDFAGRKAVVCVCKDRDGCIRETYRAMTDYLIKNNLRAESDVYSLSIVNVIDSQKMRRYLKYLFVCV